MRSSSPVPTMRIGVLSDTHIPDVLPSIPPRVLEIFTGVDIILHAGDICDLLVLHQLEPIAQTYAVYGNMDNADVKKYLQETQRLEFANRAVGLVHGHRIWKGSLLQRWRWYRNPKAREDALYDYVLGQFRDVHAIVFGHTHRPYIKMHGSVLLFNPGAVSARPGQPATVGLLEIAANTIKGRIVEVDF